MRVLLVDGNNIANRARHALKNLARSDGHLSGTVHGFLQSLRYALDKLNVELFNTVVCWDRGRADWRLELYPDYKKRDPKREVDQEEFNQFYVQMDNIQTKGLSHLSCKQLMVQGVEADDLIAIYANKLKNTGNDVFILSGDHDMHQLSGPSITIFDPVKGELTTDQIVEKWGCSISQIPMCKALIGDASDNIKGVPKIGPKRAADYLRAGAPNWRNGKAIEKINTPESQEIVNRNLKLMTLPLTWSSVPYNISIQEEADRQFTSQPNMNRAAFLEFLKEWELTAILEQASRW